MKKNLFLILASACLLFTIQSKEVTAAEAPEDFDPAEAIKSQENSPVKGFDPVDEMYIKADKGHYWEGRYSNGRVFSEYIANELAGDYENLQNYAVGGTMSGVMDGTKGEEDERSNFSNWLKGWSGVEQTERFIQEEDGEADPDSLYIIGIGGNDSYMIDDLGEERTAELSGEYTMEMVENLVESGAKYILLPDVSKDNQDKAVNFDEMQNQQVVQKVEDYLAKDSTTDEVEVIYGESEQLRDNIDEQGYEKFGYKSMGFYMISDWAPAYGYGLASEDNSDIFPMNDKEDSYGGYENYSTDSDYYTPEAADWEPDDFYTFDEYHLSSRSHKHKATYLLNSDIKTDDEKFEKQYNGKISPFAEAIDKGTIPSEYSKVYTFGDSSIDSGRGLEVTTDLVNNRGVPKNASHHVKPNDNLWNIAKENYDGDLTNARTMEIVEAIYQENQAEIQNPDLIYPNQTFELPNVDSESDK